MLSQSRMFMTTLLKHEAFKDTRALVSCFFGAIKYAQLFGYTQLSIVRFGGVLWTSRAKSFRMIFKIFDEYFRHKICHTLSKPIYATIIIFLTFSVELGNWAVGRTGKNYCEEYDYIKLATESQKLKHDFDFYFEVVLEKLSFIHNF